MLVKETMMKSTRYMVLGHSPSTMLYRRHSTTPRSQPIPINFGRRRNLSFDETLTEQTVHRQQREVDVDDNRQDRGDKHTPPQEEVFFLEL
ncbi:hypothetical protein Ae201684P_009690 [Aphanomyces euteiches]|nr:hypothetical protein Ae201684P_009690 [Aphanomyces euteiches]